MRIPCDTIARLSHLLPSVTDDKVDAALASFRLDNGMIMVSNRRYLAIEEVEPFQGVFYIRNDPALVEQCRVEAAFSSWIDFTPVPMLKHTTAITTMGFKVSENIGVWPDGPSDYDKWRDLILNSCIEPLEATAGHMAIDLEGLSELIKCSPSGKVTFEKHIDPANRPMVVRDIDSNSWVGFFKPGLVDGRVHVAASVPGWCR